MCSEGPFIPFCPTLQFLEHLMIILNLKSCSMRVYFVAEASHKLCGAGGEEDRGGWGVWSWRACGEALKCSREVEVGGGDLTGLELEVSGGICLVSGMRHW